MCVVSRGIGEGQKSNVCVSIVLLGYHTVRFITSVRSVRFLLLLRALSLLVGYLLCSVTLGALGRVQLFLYAERG